MLKSSPMLTYFKKLKKATHEHHYHQQEKNQTIIPRFLNRLWPHWVELQSNPTSALFNLHESPDTFTNVTARDWTYLKTPFSEHSIQIDRHGLLTPSNHQWSLDCWISQNTNITSPSQLLAPKQIFQENIPSLTSIFEHNKLGISLEAFIIPLPHHEDIACQIVTIENKSTFDQSFSFFFAIRPYNVEGITNLKNISYHSQNAFLTNKTIGLVLDKKPDNIMCLPFNEGDCIEHINQWDMVLHAECPLGLSNAIAEYKVTLKAGEKREFTCKIPIYTTTSPLSKSELATTISQIQSLNSATEKARMHSIWEKKKPQSTWIIPDKHLEKLILKNLFHLGSHSDTIHKPLIEKIHLFNLQSQFNPGYEAEKTSLHLLSCMDEADCYELSLYSLAITEHAERFPQQVWLEKRIQSLLVLWKKTLKATSQTQLNTFSTQVLWGLAAATKKIASTINSESKQENISTTLRSFSESCLNTIKKRCDSLHHTKAMPTLIPISESEWTDARLIEALWGVSLQLIKPNDELVSQTLQWIEKNCVLKNGILYNQLDPTGLCTHQNARLALLYSLRKDPKAFQIINWLVSTASPSGTWPGAFHPIHHVGCDGEGHSRETMSEFLYAVRSLLIQETETGLHITPHLPSNWVEKGLNITIENLPSRFGIISIQMKHIDKTISCILNCQFHKKPTEIKLSVPALIADAFTPTNTKLLIDSNTVNIPLEHTSCTIIIL